MALEKELVLVNSLRTGGVLDNGRPSFLREWEPVRFLGKGSFGEVYLIRRGGERCALKIVAMDDEFIEHYAAEIDALERIKNERHAVRIYEYAIVNIDRGPYIQKYMLIRMNLLNKLPRRMDEDQVIEMGIQLSDILAKCHGGSPKILHCDIKPENILISADGTYKLSDFGAAKISDKTHNSSGFRGTPMYMSPEMSEYRGYDHRSDLYSLGVTMYTLLNNGFPPFSDGTNNAQAIRMRFDGKKLPQIEGVSAGMMKILRKLCAAEPDRRYKNAQELSRDLKALADVRKKQREAEEEARRKAAEEEAKRRAAEQAAKEKARQAEQPQSDVYAQTAAFGKRTVQPASGQKRRPLGIIATAAALVAAIVCGAIFIPGLTKRDGNNGTGSQQSEQDIQQTSDLPALADLGSVAVGDHVTFGSYPQTEDGEVQPIEWRVLDIEDGNALMISEYLLDQKPYNEISGSVTWETCTLRKWLNESFYTTAFSVEEQSRILLRTNENQDSVYGTEGGNTTEDRVFCLSTVEVDNYFSSSDDRKAKETAYLDKDQSTGWWWLRSPGNGGSAAYVDSDGLISSGGIYVEDVIEYVRPAILVSLSGETQQAEQDAQQTGTLPALADLSSVAVGDHVTFGSYPQTEDGQVQPIEWRVLDVEADGVLMISEYLLDVHRFDDDSNDWESSELRVWLNEDFLNKAFGSSEQQQLGELNGDKVTCLRTDEAEKYFSNTTKEQDGYTTYPDRMAAPTAYAKKNGAYVYSDWGMGWWWLRSPGSYSGLAACVDNSGHILDGNGVGCSEFCVRPVVFASFSAES